MGKNIAIAILSILLVMFIVRDNITYSEMQQLEFEISLLNEHSYSDGYSEGEDDGYNFGYNNGYDEGYSDAVSEYENSGYESGYDDGHNDGYSDGLDEGSDLGFYEGTVYTCLFFNDVDRAFLSAKNGSAWYTFVDAYDMFISDIFSDDDKDKRLDLIWSLIAIDNGDSSKLTQAEKDLLIATFGSELFTKNGIPLD